MNLKEESRKLINSLQANLKHQADLSENERNQLYDFIEKLSMDFQDIADKNSIKIEIPSKQDFKYAKYTCINNLQLMSY